MEFPASLEDFTRNLKNSGMFDILCDTDYIYNVFKSNILFNKKNMNKIYKTSPILLDKIKKLEDKLLEEDNSKLEKKNKELLLKFKNLQQYNELCSNLKNNFSVNDETRIYERIIKIVKNMFTDYTSDRNKLFNEIILKIFEFKEEIIIDKNTEKKKVKNNIIRIKDNVNYKEIIKLSSNAKLIIYDLHINFFNSLNDIFKLLNEKNVISKNTSKIEFVANKENNIIESQKEYNTQSNIKDESLLKETEKEKTETEEEKEETNIIRNLTTSPNNNSLLEDKKGGKKTKKLRSKKKNLKLKK